MGRYRAFCALFSISAAVTAWYSGHTMGFGQWGQSLLVASLLVAASTAFETLRPLARATAAITAVLSGLAVALGLLAGTIGGSFNMSTEAGNLLGCFGFLFFCALLLARAHEKPGNPTNRPAEHMERRA